MFPTVTFFFFLQWHSKSTATPILQFPSDRVISHEGRRNMESSFSDFFIFSASGNKQIKQRKVEEELKA